MGCRTGDGPVTHEQVRCREPREEIRDRGRARSGDGGGLLDVVGRPGGGIGEDELLGGTATEQHGQLVDQLGASHQVLVVCGQGQGVPQ